MLCHYAVDLCFGSSFINTLVGILYMACVIGIFFSLADIFVMYKDAFQVREQW